MWILSGPLDANYSLSNLGMLLPAQATIDSQVVVPYLHFFAKVNAQTHVTPFFVLDLRRNRSCFRQDAAQIDCQRRR